MLLSKEALKRTCKRVDLPWRWVQCEKEAIAFLSEGAQFGSIPVPVDTGVRAKHLRIDIDD